MGVLTGDEVAGGVREVTSSVKPRLRLSSADVGSVSVTWSPSSCTSRAVTQAELCYQAVNVSYADDVTCVFLGSCNITVIGLEEGREFLFRVRASSSLVICIHSNLAPQFVVLFFIYYCVY